MCVMELAVIYADGLRSTTAARLLCAKRLLMQRLAPRAGRVSEKAPRGFAYEREHAVRLIYLARSSQLLVVSSQANAAYAALADYYNHTNTETL
jgi:hypothetical protein